jgi:hypothetical protein
MGAHSIQGAKPGLYFASSKSHAQPYVREPGTWKRLRRHTLDQLQPEVRCPESGHLPVGKSSGCELPARFHLSFPIGRDRIAACGNPSRRANSAHTFSAQSSPVPWRTCLKRNCPPPYQNLSLVPRGSVASGAFAATAMIGYILINNISGWRISRNGTSEIKGGVRALLLAGAACPPFQPPRALEVRSWSMENPASLPDQ